MQNIVFAITLFSVPLFFGVTSLLGVAYDGAGSSNLYRNYCILVFVLSMSCIFFGRKNYSAKHSSTLTYWVLFIYVFAGILSGYVNDSLWLTLVAFSLPAACIGAYFANDRGNALFKMAKLLDVLFVILTVCVISLSTRLFMAVATGDSEYSQSLSYYAALCFVLDIFLFLYGKSYDRFKFFKNKYVQFLYFCLLPTFIVVIFFSGGRGGFVVVAVGIFAIAFMYRKVKWKSLVSGVVVIFVFTSLLSYYSEEVSSDIMAKYQENQHRVLAYIDVEDLKIDMTQTSGRDHVYQDSWNMFLNSPIIGYGIFDYKTALKEKYDQPYPHNLFLEWLLQGGVFFFCIWFYAFCMMLVRLHRLIRQDIRYVILLPFLVHALVELMFTGTYMGNTFFWFVLSFSLNKKISSHPPLTLKTERTV